MHLEKKFPENSIIPPSPKQKLAAALLQLYGAQHLQMAIMHYRWSFPENHDPYIYYNFGSSFNPDGDYESTLEFGEMVATKFRGFCKLGFEVC